MSNVQMVVVTPEEAGQKLLQFLQRRVDKGVPKSAIMRWIRTGQVRVNKGRVKAFVRLGENDVVRIPPYSIDEGKGADENHSAKINRKDDSPADVRLEGILPVAGKANGLLVINKPAGLPVQPGTGHTDAVTTRLKAAFDGAPFCPTPAHRLDKNTSGLLLVATSYNRLQDLHELFRNEHAIGKHYLAWVEGRWEHKSPVELSDTLAKQRQQNGKERMETHAIDGKEALCRVTPLSVSTERSLLHIELKTGRTHQIRVQLSSRSHPIIGDIKYGAAHNRQGMLLHAWRVILPNETFSCLPEWKRPFAVSEEEVKNVC